MTAAAHRGAAALSVRPGEKPWTGQELAEVRKELEAEAAGLREDISTAESEIAARLGDAVGDAGDDSADAGAKTFQREHELALTQNARELLTQIERALAGSRMAVTACANRVASHREGAVRRFPVRYCA